MKMAFRAERARTAGSRVVAMKSTNSTFAKHAPACLLQRAPAKTTRFRLPAAESSRRQGGSVTVGENTVPCLLLYPSAPPTHPPTDGRAPSVIAMSTSSTTERPQLKLVPHFELPQLKFPAPLQALRRAAWKGHGAILPLLHATDPVRPKNTCLNLHILWLKALAGTRGETDDHLSYRLLPKKSRWLISRPFCWLYPPWHHDTVAQGHSSLTRRLPTS